MEQCTVSRSCLFLRCTIVALITFTGCSHSKQSVALYESGDYAGAARAADQGLVEHPGDDSLWAMRIRAALALGDGAAIAKAYDGYVAERGGDDPQLLRDLAVATLGQALASPSARLKIIVIDTAAEHKIEALAQQVIERLDDEDDRVQATAAIAVISTPSPRAPRIADDMLRSPNAEARRIAVDGVGKKVGKLAAADIERAASDEDPRGARSRCAGSARSRTPIASRRASPTPRTPTKACAPPPRARSARSASAISPPSASRRSPSRARGPTRRLELYATAHRDDLLVSVVDDKGPLVAAEAAIAIATSHPGMGQQPVERGLAAPQWPVRAGIATAGPRGRQGGRHPVRAPARRRQGGVVRLAAARVLAHGGDPELAARVFAEALADPDQGPARRPISPSSAIPAASRRCRTTSAIRTARRTSAPPPPPRIAPRTA